MNRFLRASAIVSALVLSACLDKTSAPLTAPGGIRVFRGGTAAAVGVPAGLYVVAEPGSATSGAPFDVQPVVWVIDDEFGPVVTATNPVTVSIAPTYPGTVSADNLTVSAVDGTATFSNVAVTVAGPYPVTTALRFSSPGLADGFTLEFAVDEGVVFDVPTSLAMQLQPSAAAESGVPFATQPKVKVLDQSGNPHSISGLTVTAAITGAGGTLVGTASATTVGGVATFDNLQINGPGAFTLVFSAGTLNPATSGTVTVTQVARSLRIDMQPGGAVSGSLLAPQPAVKLLDAAGIPMDGANAINPITAALASGPAGATLTGNTKNADHGLATFTNLAVTGSGIHTLKFSTPGAADATSAQFTIGKAPGSISISGPASLTYNTSGTITPTATGDGAVTYAVTGGPCTISGPTVTTNSGTGSCTVQATLGEGTNYLSAVSNVLTIAAVKAGATLTLGNLSQVYDGTPKSASVVTAPAGLTGVAVTYNGSPTLPTVAGSYAVSATLTNANYAATPVTGTLQIIVLFNWKGFFKPIANPDTVNKEQAGSTIPIKFSLGGNKGFNIFAEGYPVSLSKASCTDFTLDGVAIPIVIQQANHNDSHGNNGNNGNNGHNSSNGLSYDDGKYQMDWKTEKVWAGSCRLLVVKLIDGTVHTAMFSFKPLPATQLAVVTQPSATAESGVAFTAQPVIEVQDATGAPSMTENGSKVRVSISSHDDDDALGGTTTATIDNNGRATFTNLKINGAGTFKLKFTASDLKSATSANVVVTAPVVVFNWQGFFDPIDNPTIANPNKSNSNQAGSTIPIKFSLGGNKGLKILLPGYPKSQAATSCANFAGVGPETPIAVQRRDDNGSSSGNNNYGNNGNNNGNNNNDNGGGSSANGLSYDDGKYQIDWKTEKGWKGTCRVLIVKLIDGSTHTANFNFK